jgi:hypothetical protein
LRSSTFDGRLEPGSRGGSSQPPVAPAAALAVAAAACGRNAKARSLGMDADPLMPHLYAALAEKERRLI